MSFADPAPVSERARTALAVAVLHIALGYALITGLAVDLPTRISDGLTLFALLPPAVRPPPPPPAVHHARAARREGAAAPPNLEARATPVVAPPPRVVTPVPSPIVAAPVAGTGAADHDGAAPIVGLGSGSGGQGDGTGSGGKGDGPGGGGGGRDWEQLTEVGNRDYPPAAVRAGVSGRVGVRFTVGIRGRVTDCRVTRSSGHPELDDGTCPAIVRRLRFRPELDRDGRPVPAVIDGEHVWNLWRSPDADADDDDDR